MTHSLKHGLIGGAINCSRWTEIIAVIILIMEYDLVYKAPKQFPFTGLGGGGGVRMGV